MKFRLFAATALFSVGLAAVAHAESRVAADWEGHIEDTRCYNVTFPQDSQGAPQARGKTYLALASYPRRDLYDSVTIVSGFADTTGAKVEATIDDKKSFKLLPFGEAAYAQSGQPEKDMIAAMKAGKELTVKWTSPKGRVITDQYSLIGFTATMDYINAHCTPAS